MVTVDRFVHVDVRSQYRILEHVATITQKSNWNCHLHLQYVPKNNESGFLISQIIWSIKFKSGVVPRIGSGNKQDTGNMI